MLVLDADCTNLATHFLCEVELIEIMVSLQTVCLSEREAYTE